MQTYMAAPSYAMSPLRPSHSALSMVTATKLETTYNLAGLEDRECVEKLLIILDGKEKEIEKLKRSLATKNYDAAWGGRQRGSISLQQQKQQQQQSHHQQQQHQQQQRSPTRGSRSPSRSRARGGNNTTGNDGWSEEEDGNERENEEPNHAETSEQSLLIFHQRAKIEELERRLNDAEMAGSPGESARRRSGDQKLILFLKQSVRDLEAKLAKKDKEEASEVAEARSSEQKHISSLKHRIRELEDMAADRDDAKGSDKRIVAALKTRVRDLEEELAVAEATIAADSDRLGDRQNQHQSVETLTSHIRDLESRLARSEDAETELREQRHEDQALIRELNERLEGAQAKLDDAETGATNAASLLFEHERVSDQRLIDQLETAVKDLEAQLKRAKDAATDADRDIASLRKANNVLTGRIRDLEAAVAKAVATPDPSVIERMERVASERNALKRKVRDTTAQLERVQDQAAEQAKDRGADRSLIASLKERLNSAEDAMAESMQLSREVAMAEKSNGAAERTIQHLTSQIRELTTQLSAVKGKFASNTSTDTTERDQERKVLKQAMAKIRSLEARIEDLQANAAADAETLVARRTAEKKLMQQMKIQIRTLQSDLQKAQENNNRRPDPKPSTQTKDSQTPPLDVTAPALALMEQEYEDLRIRLHTLAEDVQRTVLGDQPGSPVKIPPRIPTARPTGQSTADKTLAISSAFKSLHAVLSHLSERCQTSNETAVRTRAELRKTVGALKKARSDVSLAEQARNGLVERVKELEDQCVAKRGKLQLLDDLIRQTGRQSERARREESGAGANARDQQQQQQQPPVSRKPDTRTERRSERKKDGGSPRRTNGEQTQKTEGGRDATVRNSGERDRDRERSAVHQDLEKLKEELDDTRKRQERPMWRKVR
ncbi:hypothetical protein HKX48_009593 [Thoreauomyces humboldtii]|nr:hypothetical protein HKX48_009593 [Thoreauomyces humboldtii]